MFFKSKCIDFVTRGHQLRNDLATKGFKRLLVDECGGLSIDGLAKEAIAVLILIIIFAIAPKIGMMVSSSLGNISNSDLESARQVLNAAQQKLNAAITAGTKGQDLTAFQTNVTQAQEAFNSLFNQAAGGWATAPDGAALWTQMAGIIQIAALILIVAIIISAVYRFKQ